MVGYVSSTFSYLLRELRALHGHPKATTYLVRMPRPDWGAELFEQAGRLAE